METISMTYAKLTTVFLTKYISMPIGKMIGGQQSNVKLVSSAL